MRRIVGVAAMAAALYVPAAAQESGISKKQADEILSELRQIRQILEKQANLAQQAARQPQETAPSQKVKVQLNDAYLLGSPDAPLTMVEFTDYQCPFCQRFHSTTFYEIKKNWIDTGKLRFYSRDFPLGFHPNAFRASEAARCAGDQKQFWRMRDLLASNPGKLLPENLEGYAREISLDTAAFKTCLESGKHKAGVEADLKMAEALGVSGTPSFIVGRSTKEGVEGELVVGAMPLAAFEEKLKEFAGAK